MPVFAGTLQSKVKNVFFESVTCSPGYSRSKWFTTSAPPKSRALFTSILIQTSSPDLTVVSELQLIIFSMTVCPTMFTFHIFSSNDRLIDTYSSDFKNTFKEKNKWTDNIHTFVFITLDFIS